MSSETNKPAQPGCKAFVSRVAQPADIPALLQLARETDLGSIRADRDRIAHEVEICHRTLQGKIPWEQGMLFLVTDCYRQGSGPCVVGQAKIRWAFDACWIRITRVREWESKTTPHDVLVYHCEPSGALEFAGNAVLEEYQSQGIGGFQTKARVLFLLLFDLPGVNKIFADFLTQDVNGRYPFYEEIVRPLLGNLDYDEPDTLRHEARGGRVAMFEHHLGPTNDRPACELLLHALPAHIRDSFGSVRPQSLPAAKALEKYGFSACNKYDLLDGGQYMETSIASLRATARIKTLYAERAPRSGPASDPQRVVFSPRRTMTRFVAVRAIASAVGHQLLIEPDLFHALNLGVGEPVEVFF